MTAVIPPFRVTSGKELYHKAKFHCQLAAIGIGIKKPGTSCYRAIKIRTKSRKTGNTFTTGFLI